MHLINPSIVHIRQLMTWFSDEISVRIWGGPDFRFPFTEESFLQDIYWGRMATYALIDENSVLIALGQLYEKAGRAHLARLAVAPEHRGLGYGGVLVTELIKKGRELFPGANNSLYVLRTNEQALRCYRRAGFEEALPPVEDRIYPDQVFMVRRA